MKVKKKGIFRLMIAILAALTMIVGTATVSLAEANEAVNEATKGVVHVRVLYQDNDKEYDVQWGSGFLINDMTVITCHHVVHVSDATIQEMRESSDYGPLVEGKSDKQIRDKMIIKITVYQDSGIPATIEESCNSQKGDYVALKLKSSLGGYTPLKIRDTTEVKATEQAYALGFPAKMVALKGLNASDFTRESVTVTQGGIQKIDYNEDMGLKNVYMSGTITEGYSGGPLVDENGNVIGILYGGDYENLTAATASEELMKVLDPLQMEYTKADGAPSADEEKADEEVAEEVPEPVQPETPAEPEKKTNYVPFIIGGAAVVILGILAAVLISRKKKNDAPTPAGATYAAGGPAPVNPVTGTGRPAGAAPVVPPAVPGGYAGSPTPDTSVLNQGSNETTVLGQGAGETSVLAETHVNGSLVREKNGEKINITRDNFKIGRERSKVDYCISDNTAVGRHHATIIIRNDEAYLVDQNSRNYTFLNDVKVAPNVETKLHEGDKISFADEAYTYHAR